MARPPRSCVSLRSRIPASRRAAHLDVAGPGSPPAAPFGPDGGIEGRPRRAALAGRGARCTGASGPLGRRDRTAARVRGSRRSPLLHLRRPPLSHPPRVAASSEIPPRASAPESSLSTSGPAAARSRLHWSTRARSSSPSSVIRRGWLRLVGASPTRRSRSSMPTLPTSDSPAGRSASSPIRRFRS